MWVDKAVAIMSKNALHIQQEVDPVIAFNTGPSSDGSEMLKITPAGFWVRGVKVPQGPDEARLVYEAFQQWMLWAALTRDYK